MLVVTSGSGYLDIDAYAGCIAYAELLRLQGRPAVAVSSALPNRSVPAMLRGLGASLDSYKPKSGDGFILVDISNSDFFDPVVAQERIVELVDHHPGFEGYWRERLGSRSDIEPVGACCTQIFERWQKAGKLDSVRRDSACLLAAGILDNTLCFRARITTQRDRAAYAELARIAALPEDWAARYFSACQEEIEADLENALCHDCKNMDPSLGLPRVLGQLAVWDARALLERNRAVLEGTLKSMDEDWALNCISISEGASYFLAGLPSGRERLSGVAGAAFSGAVARSARPWLRKELLAAALAGAADRRIAGAL